MVIFINKVYEFLYVAEVIWNWKLLSICQNAFLM